MVTVGWCLLVKSVKSAFHVTSLPKTARDPEWFELCAVEESFIIPPTSHQHPTNNLIQLTHMHPSSLLMRTFSRTGSIFPARISRILVRNRRPLITLAIETSCDDTSVAILEHRDRSRFPRAVLHFHKKITSNSSVYQGIHPIVSLESHQESLATLINEAIQELPSADFHEGDDAIAVANQAWRKRKPDFISVTRGPGMRSNLFTGLDTAKGLAVAWQVLDTRLGRSKWIQG